MKLSKTNKCFLIGLVLIFCLIILLFSKTNIYKQSTNIFDGSNLNFQVYYINCNKYFKNSDPFKSNYLFIVSVKDKNNKLDINKLKDAKVELLKPASFGKRQINLEKNTETINKILDQKIIRNDDVLFIYQIYEVINGVEISFQKYFVNVSFGNDSKEYSIDIVATLANS